LWERWADWRGHERVGPTLEKIRKVYGDKVRIVWKHDPLDIHKDAPQAHIASVAADQQGKFWEFHDKVFAGQPKIQKNFLPQYVRDLGLDMKRFEEDIFSPRSRAPVDTDMAEAKALGVTGTPAFFVNGPLPLGRQAVRGFRPVHQRRADPARVPRSGAS
jgi:protein-disulfide isomerase